MEKKSNLIFFLLLALAFTAVCLSLKGIEFNGVADEGHYLGYASHLEANGIGSYKDLFWKYTQNPDWWIFASPLRAGFLIISALWLKILGHSFFNLACLSVFFYLLFLAVNFYFSRVYFGSNLALLFTILLAFSPIEMAMARRALLESAVALTCSASIWLFWDYLQRRKSYKLFIFALVYAAAILIKESSVLLSIVFAGFLLIRALYFKLRVTLAEVIAICVLPPVLFVLALIVLGGGPYIAYISQIIICSPSNNAYALLFGRGPWFRYLIDFFALSPLVMILSLGFITYYFTLKKREGTVSYFIFVFLAAFCLFNLFTKNVRYVILLDMPLRLFTLLMIKELCQRYFPKAVMPAMTVCVLLLVSADYLNFHSIFVREAVYDPVSFSLFKANHMIP
ncbi:MAG: glycosyltransferase family 39 protein [Candidatus Omnitrophica bacterium]|nr:glycosyltransferase family 39 protein [Candidatus Omnitrophota bacterium]